MNIWRQKMKNLISIIVPIYNVEKYIDKCINSILCQTYKNLEIILVDDGSTDGSEIICDKYKNLDSRVHVIHKQNGGLVSARKAGLKIATGSFVGFVDGDDYIENCMYESLINIIQSSKADFVHSGYKKNDENAIRGSGNFEIIDFFDEDNRVAVINRLIFDLKKSQIMSPGLCFKLFKYDVITESYNMVPDDQSYGEDLVALCDILQKCKRIVISPEGYYHYIVREESIMNHISKKKMFRENALRDKLVTLFKEYVCNKSNFDFIVDSIDTYWLTGIIDDIKKIAPDVIRVFKCSFVNELRNKRIVIYGAGNVGFDYYMQLKPYEDIVIVEWLDKNHKSIKNDYHRIESVETICSIDFDYVVIAVLDKNIAYKIIDELIEKGIDRNRILWKKPILSSTL